MCLNIKYIKILNTTRVNNIYVNLQVLTQH